MIKEVCTAPMAVVRPSLIYGAADTHNGYGPNQFLRLALADKEITLFGEGEEQRDHVFVEDVVDILRLIILHQSKGVLNVATGTVESFRRVAEIVTEFFVPQTIINTKPRLGPMPHKGYRSFDITLCRKVFPEFRYTSLAEGLAKSHKQMMEATGNGRN